MTPIDQTITRHEWHGCYNDSWNLAPLVPEAFSHPAKVSYGLAERIYQHLLAQGYVKRGSVIVDPFGGIGGFAFHALYYGLHFKGCELESKFVDMAAGYDCPGFHKADWRRYQTRAERIKPRLCPKCASSFANVGKGKSRLIPTVEAHHFTGNFELWNGRYKGVLPNWGTAEIFQGDSRRLCEVLGVGGAAVISSPPYASLVNANGEGPNSTGERHGQESSTENAYKGRNYGSTPGQLGAMKEGQPPDAIISSPPYADSNDHERPLDSTRSKNGRHTIHLPYGDSDGNIGSMREGQPPDAIISSPPYADAMNATTGGIDWNKSGRPDKMKPSPNRHNGMTDGLTKYGDSEGQLGSMAVVGSPPFESVVSTKDVKYILEKKLYGDYGSTPNNIGNTQGDTFWDAAKIIIDQCYQLLPVGGVAVWVCGDFVRKGKRVEFGRQWVALCEAVGFVAIEHIVAWKREPGPVQAGIFEDVDMTVDRVSFFRRLSNNKNPDNAILNEDVIIVRKV